MVFSFMKFQQQSHVFKAVVDMLDEFGFRLADALVRLVDSMIRIIDALAYFANAAVGIQQDKNRKHDANCNSKDLGVGQWFLLPVVSGTPIIPRWSF